jgi:hypothetical protein
MSAPGLGRVKTKSDLVVVPSGRQIFAFFGLRMTIGPEISGVVVPRGVFTQPGSFAIDADGPANPVLSALPLHATLVHRGREMARRGRSRN